MMKEKFQRILDNSTKENQVLQSVEELSELIQALMKNINRGKDNEKDILSEVADVQIMLEQLKLVYKFTEEDVKNEMEFKLNRFYKRKGWDIQ